MKRIFTKLLLLLPAVLILINFSVVPYAAADTCGQDPNSPTGQVLQGVTQTSAQANCGGSGVTNIVSTVVNILSYVVGILAIIMIIIAGFKYITAGGDSNQVSSAKSTLIYAIVGLVIAALAQVIVHEVLNTAASATPH